LPYWVALLFVKHGIVVLITPRWGAAEEWIDSCLDDSLKLK
jgi:hypothetical protein